MTENNHAQRAQHYRNRADELRAIAATMKEPSAREAIARLAASYDSMADSLGVISSIIDRFALPTPPDAPTASPQE